MKTAKKVIAIILSIATLLCMGATNAFAAEIGDEIKWTTIYEDGEEYYYYEFGGTLNEGENVIIGDYEGWYEKVYEFEAAQEGYYFITSDYWIKIAQAYQNEEAFNNADWCEMCYMTAEDDYTWGKVYYLPAGTALIAAETYYDYENNVNIEYLGDISELTFDEESLSCNILGVDAYYYEEEGYIEFYAAFTAEFTNGKVLTADDIYVYTETNGAIAEGENVIPFTFLEYETEIYVDFYDITYFVESIELQKNDLHLNAKYYYDGAIEYFDLGDKPEYVTVNYTDGTSRAFEFYYGPSYTNNTIILPNGREVYVYAYLDTNDEGEICFVAGMADHNFIEEPCTIDGVSFSENFDHFSENLTYIIEDGLHFIVNRFEYMADALAYGDFEYFMYQLQRLFESPYLGYFFGEISSFINYYI